MEKKVEQVIIRNLIYIFLNYKFKSKGLRKAHNQSIFIWNTDRGYDHHEDKKSK